jgi:tRNA (guanine-N7-)-methyltransferase
LARVRVRQHVNPLSQIYQTPIVPPDWNQVYAEPQQPLHLDIGCGWGRFLLEMAQLEPAWNFLGLEIREPLVHQALEIKSQAGLTNLYYLFCNANNSLKPLLDTLPPGVLQRVTIQFPDPWFKKRHQKRRVVQPDLVQNLAIYLAQQGQVFIQSDIKEVAQEIYNRFEENPAFQRVQTEHQWMPENPLPIATERELHVLNQQLPVYRTLFVRV